MSWHEKDHLTAFEAHLADIPIHGLCFLDGDLLASVLGRDWTKGQKYPVIAFPSGMECDLWECSRPERGGIVHIFGEMDLPYYDTRDRAYGQAFDIAEQCGYMVRKVGNSQLEVWGHDTDEHVIITYDQEAEHIHDIRRVKDDAPPPRPPLLPDDIRAKLPELYSGEEQGLEAKALVKFFTPSSNWMWYATEFDGEDRFFGLVIGHEMELGYFLLSELESVIGPLGLPIERDKFFEPKTLRELQEEHRRSRGEQRYD